MFRTERFRQLMRQERWTYKRLGEELGLENQTVSKWANGSIKPKKLHAMALAQVIKVPLSELWEDDNVPEN